MILSDVLSFARAQSQTDSNGLTDANGIIFANEALVDFHRRLIVAGVDASQIQEAYTNATAGTGRYLYPTDMLFLKTIEANYANTTASSFFQASQIDISNTPNGVSLGWLRQYADRYSPLFDDHGDWFELFPTFTSSDNVTQAIRIVYYLKPTVYTSVSDTVSYPENIDVAILGMRIASRFKASLADFISSQDFNTKYEERVQQYIANLSRGVQTPTQAVPLQITGWQF